MFVALEADEYQSTGILGDIFNIIKKPKARIEAREAMGAVYGVITAPRPVREADWKKIAALADRYADTMLLPVGMTPPPPISEAKFPRFERRILLKTATEIVKRTRMPMYKRIAGLVDKTGEYADFLFPLLHHYTAVKVLTGQVDLYRAGAEHMMAELGAPVLICDDYAALGDCVLIIAPDGIETAGRMRCPVLSRNPPQTSQSSDFITSLRILPYDDNIVCPKGIEPHKFYAALYEYCGVEDVRDIAEQMIFKYRTVDLTQVVNAVNGIAGVSELY